jgi:hypothetical protein
MPKTWVIIAPMLLDFLSVSMPERQVLVCNAPNATAQVLALMHNSEQTKTQQP